MSSDAPPPNACPSPEEIGDAARHTLGEAVALARTALEQGDPMDTHLAEVLRGELERGTGVQVLRVRRVLEVLSELGADQLVVPLRLVLFSQPDAHIRSKATLMVGRATKSVAFISKRLMDPDERVQANAVQSLWGAGTQDAREVLESALRSQNNRVVANALVGLYRIDDVTSIGRLYAMAGHDVEMFRVSARWAMGETGDPRFLPFLKAALQTDAARCRGMVIRSLARLRRRLASLETGRLPIEIWDRRTLPDGACRIGLSLLAGSGDERIAIGPMDVVITAGSKPVTDFSVVGLTEPDRLVVGFALPRITSLEDPFRIGMERGLGLCVQVKPERDLWSIDRYWAGAPAEGELRPELAMALEDPVLVSHLRNNRGCLTNRNIIMKVVSSPGPREKASHYVEASARKLMDTVARVGGTHHVFVFLDPEMEIPETAPSGLAIAAVENGVSIHAVALERPEGYAGMEALCLESGGTFEMRAPDAMAESIQRRYQALRNRYEITYRDGGETPAEITIYSSAGWNTVTV